jgi:hypothetical protein
MELDFIIVMGVFTMCCAYFNWKSGYRNGVAEGMELTLKMLEDGGYIKIVNDEITAIAKVSEIRNDA